MINKYVGFVDPSGGSQDAYTLAIAHRDKVRNIVVLDLVAERLPPFSPEGVTGEYVQICQRYGIQQVVGDHYAGEWPREQFRKLGVAYKVSPLTKSEIYLNALPLMTSARVELLDHKRLLGQLRALERRVSRGGKDSIDHPPRAKDDVANAACGAIVNVQLGMGQFVPITFAWSAEFGHMLSNEPGFPQHVSAKDLAAIHPDERAAYGNRAPTPIVASHEVDNVSHRSECRACRRTWRNRP